MTGEAALIIAAVGFGGFGLGVGLVIGAFVARALRKYMRDEGFKGSNGDGHRP